MKREFNLKALAHVAAGAKEQLVQKSFLSISQKESGGPEKHNNSGKIMVVTG